MQAINPVLLPPPEKLGFTERKPCDMTVQEIFTLVKTVNEKNEETYEANMKHLRDVFKKRLKGKKVRGFKILPDEESVEVEELFVKLMNSEDPYLRRSVAKCVSAICDFPFEKYIFQPTLKFQEINFILVEEETIKEMESNINLEEILKSVESEDEETRYYALQALGCCLALPCSDENMRKYLRVFLSISPEKYKKKNFEICKVVALDDFCHFFYAKLNKKEKAAIFNFVLSGADTFGWKAKHVGALFLTNLILSEPDESFLFTYVKPMCKFIQSAFQRRHADITRESKREMFLSIPRGYELLQSFSQLFAPQALKFFEKDILVNLSSTQWEITEGAILQFTAICSSEFAVDNLVVKDMIVKCCGQLFKRLRGLQKSMGKVSVKEQKENDLLIMLIMFALKQIAFTKLDYFIEFFTADAYEVIFPLLEITDIDVLREVLSTLNEILLSQMEMLLFKPMIVEKHFEKSCKYLFRIITDKVLLADKNIRDHVFEVFACLCGNCECLKLLDPVFYFFMEKLENGNISEDLEDMYFGVLSETLKRKNNISTQEFNALYPMLKQKLLDSPVPIVNVILCLEAVSKTSPDFFPVNDEELKNILARLLDESSDQIVQVFAMNIVMDLDLQDEDLLQKVQGLRQRWSQFVPPPVNV